MFDQDGSGSISFDELATVMRILGNNPTDQELQDIMNGLDRDSKFEKKRTSMISSSKSHDQ